MVSFLHKSNAVRGIRIAIDRPIRIDARRELLPLSLRPRLHHGLFRCLAVLHRIGERNIGVGSIAISYILAYTVINGRDITSVRRNCVAGVAFTGPSHERHGFAFFICQNYFMQIIFACHIDIIIFLYDNAHIVHLLTDLHLTAKGYGIISAAFPVALRVNDCSVFNNFRNRRECNCLVATHAMRNTVTRTASS